MFWEGRGSCSSSDEVRGEELCLKGMRICGEVKGSRCEDEDVRARRRATEDGRILNHPSDVGNEFEFPRRIRLGQEFRGGRTCFISCLCFCVCTPGLGDEQPRR